jgi:hypothetical protein
MDQRRFGRAEKALLEAADYRALELAWSAYCCGFDDKSAEYRRLLSIYQDVSARFAVEAFKVVRAG